MRNDVLIIGAGPSGLFAAAELARHGVEARLIEREVRPHRQARATAIQPGSGGGDRARRGQAGQGRGRRSLYPAGAA